MNDVRIEGEQLVTLPDVARALFAGRWKIIGITILVTACFAGYAFFATPIYRATAVLAQVNIDRGGSGSMSSALGQLGDLASLAGVNIDPKDKYIDEAIEVLKSREFLQRFIADFDLLPRFFSSKWDHDAKRWKVAESKQPTPWKGYRFFTQQIFGVDKDKKTGLISVRIDWKNREEAAKWANELVDRVNAEMRARAIATAQSAAAYLEKEREATSFAETRTSINRLIEIQIRQKMLATVNPDFIFRTVDRALPADVDDVLKPKKLVLICIGAFLGILLSCIALLMRAHYRGDLTRTSPQR
jgi:uncharacterized protein involved in exopolysaccharide biosynthesis